MSDSARAPMAFGVVGMGGYAGAVANQLLTAGAAADGAVARLVAACDPAVDGALRERAADLRQRGVRIHSRLEGLLDEPDVEALWLPVPIPLHRPFTEAALAAGKAIIVEKPAAGCIDDVDAMIRARDAAGLPVAVGFQSLYDPANHQAKRRLLDGAIGEIVSATLIGCWPRKAAYYARSAWAGRIRMDDGTWVLDSAANNAMAHPIHLALFLLGQTLEATASPDSIEAELYRAYPIENHDTCSLRITVNRNERPIPLLVAMTHACAETIDPLLVIHGTAGTLRYDHGHGVRIEAGGEMWQQPSGPQTVERFVRWARTGEGIVATLESARAHTLAMSAASQAAPVRPIPPSYVQTRGQGPDQTRFVPGIEDALRACVQTGRMLHESGRVPWSAPADRMDDLSGYRHFTGPAVVEGR